MKLKEYKLIIIFDPDSGEVQHLEESCNSHYKFAINNEILCISEEMEEYLEKHLDGDILGFC
tara:strand:+ start:288 stop:473 length:186 start_codon:yes stop_codon:yes gene_type:complete